MTQTCYGAATQETLTASSVDKKPCYALPLWIQGDSFYQPLLNTLRTRHMQVMPTLNKMERVSRTLPMLSRQPRMAEPALSCQRKSLGNPGTLGKTPSSCHFLISQKNGRYAFFSFSLAIYYLNSVSKSLSRANAQLRKKIQAVSLSGATSLAVFLFLADLLCDLSCVLPMGFCYSKSKILPYKEQPFQGSTAHICSRNISETDSTAQCRESAQQSQASIVSH